MCPADVVQGSKAVDIARDWEAKNGGTQALADRSPPASVEASFPTRVKKGNVNLQKEA